jgi:hypothetical protein
VLCAYFLLFIKVAIKAIIDLIVSGVAHPFTRFVIVPLLAAFGWLWYIENEFVDEILYGFWLVVWWFGLGVLSSVGLGSGMHSGILFLFPHIFKVVHAAKKCQDMNFDSHSDMWWQTCTMKCESSNPVGECLIGARPLCVVCDCCAVLHPVPAVRLY